MASQDSIAQILRNIALLQEQTSRLFRSLADAMESSHAHENPIVLTDTSELLPDNDDSQSAVAEQKVEEYLTLRGMSIASYRPIDSIPAAWCKIADFIADKYDNVREFIMLIKKHQCDRFPFTMNLRGFSQQEISDITNLAHLAYQCGLLPSVRYFKSPRFQLMCAPPTAPDAINFFTGDWLEIYIYFTCLQFLERLPQDARPSMLSGVHAIAENGDQIELDFCILLPSGRFICVEGKTGIDYQHLLPKYKQLGKLLGVEKSDALLVNPNFRPRDEIAQSHAKLANMTPCSLSEFADVMAEAMGALAIG